MYLINVHTWYVNMPNVIASYERFTNLIAFSGNFHIFLHVCNVMCAKAEVQRCKAALCSHLRLCQSSFFLLLLFQFIYFSFFLYFYIGNGRKSKPYARALVADLTTCWKDPNIPGPGDYFWNDSHYNVKFKENRINEEKRLPIFYYNGTTVPFLGQSYCKESFLKPDPARYTIECIDPNRQ